MNRNEIGESGSLTVKIPSLPFLSSSGFLDLCVNVEPHGTRDQALGLLTAWSPGFLCGRQSVPFGCSLHLFIVFIF